MTVMGTVVCTWFVHSEISPISLIQRQTDARLESSVKALKSSVKALESGMKRLEEEAASTNLASNRCSTQCLEVRKLLSGPKV
jgi:hypothetical protein